MKAVVAAFNQEKALVGAFSVIVQPVVKPMDRFAALLWCPHQLRWTSCSVCWWPAASTISAAASPSRMWKQCLPRHWQMLWWDYTSLVSDPICSQIWWNKHHDHDWLTDKIVSRCTWWSMATWITTRSPINQHLCSPEMAWEITWRNSKVLQVTTEALIFVKE